MILGFADGTTRDIYDGHDTKAARRIPRELWAPARRKLDLLDAANGPRDLRVPPGNMLEKLKGKPAGKWSIRVNDQYRIVFAWADGNASDVQVVDYH